MTRDFEIKSIEFSSFRHITQDSTISKYNSSKIYINGNFETLMYGDIISPYDIKCSTPSTTYDNPTSFDFPHYLLGKHININCNINDYYLNSHRNSILNIVRNFRIRLIRRFYDFPLLTSLLLGYKDENNSDIYANSGLSHLFVISGTHIAVIIGFLNNLSGILKFSTKKRRYFMTFILIIYSFIAGFNLPVNRVIIIYVLNLYNEKYNWYNISIGFLLLINPFITFSFSFILSYLISFYIMNFLNQRKGIYGIFLANVELFLITLPFQILFNSSINPLTPILNLIFIPLFTFIIIPLCMITFIFPIHPLLSFSNYIYSCISSILAITSSFQIYVGIHHNSIIYIYYFIYYLYKVKQHKNFLYFFPILIFIFLSNQFTQKIIIPDSPIDQFIIIKSKNNNIIINPPADTFNEDLINLLKYYQIYNIDQVINISGDIENTNLLLNYFQLPYYEQTNYLTLEQRNNMFILTLRGEKKDATLIFNQDIKSVSIIVDNNISTVTYSNNSGYNPSLLGLLEVIL